MSEDEVGLLKTTMKVEDDLYKDRSLGTEAVVHEGLVNANKSLTEAICPQDNLYKTPFFAPGWDASEITKLSDATKWAFIVKRTLITNLVTAHNQELQGKKDSNGKPAKVTQEGNVYHYGYIDKDGQLIEQQGGGPGDLIFGLEIIEAQEKDPQRKAQTHGQIELLKTNTDAILGQERISYENYEQRRLKKAQEIAQEGNLGEFNQLNQEEQWALLVQAEISLEPKYELVCAGEAVKPEEQATSTAKNQLKTVDEVKQELAEKWKAKYGEQLLPDYLKQLDEIAQDPRLLAEEQETWKKRELQDVAEEQKLINMIIGTVGFEKHGPLDAKGAILSHLLRSNLKNKTPEELRAVLEKARKVNVAEDILGAIVELLDFASKQAEQTALEGVGVQQGR